ncbi:MAG: oxidoreductase [Candidatus Omnitrophica bacterium CG11_big_fil_rev_8_21_14_0_20_45_26]|uniref:Oxidoreductase n=1 Tax=Candidatus Abzuiibacterium crystallinum TaxID=1974748 RepID=A0A2H0LLT9_9BACT|nr:MAG: oxidoreductase [Candidatus Omnitrophica bacterium CG11_big_fil_rev_8_21_14_0_20_45_26]PIW63265.1 MAG: gfo/Idh/MocA family oxidoreductase [Candidatus Omnitrophica bacterium CG12_big_fil_rev_8_21_14_0_65_45_16]
MKILMVGLGGSGQRLLRIFSEKVPDKQFYAYRVKRRLFAINPNFSVNQSENIEQKYRITVLNDLDQALAVCPDVTVVTNPTSHHLETAIKAASTGSDLFIEKPISHTLDGLEKLAQIVKKKQLIVFTGYQMRFHPAIQKIQALVSSGKLGQIMFAKLYAGSFLPAWHPYESYKDLYAARQNLGGGVLLTESHEFDYAYWLFGVPKRIYATGGNLGPEPLEVEDTASVVLEYYAKTTDRAFHVHLELCMMQTVPSRGCEIQGTKGSVIWRQEDNCLKIWDQESKQTSVQQFDAFERIEMYRSEIDHFLSCVKTRKSPLINLQDATNSLKMVLAAKNSMKTHQAVMLK